MLTIYVEKSGFALKKTDLYMIPAEEHMVFNLMFIF